MYRQQVQFIITLVVLADGLLVIAAGYLAEYIRWRSNPFWDTPEDVLVGVILGLMFVNTFVMGRLGLYSDRRIPSVWRMMLRVAAAVFTDFSLLLVALYSFHVLAMSRLFLVLYAALLLGFFLAERLVLEAYLEHRKRKGFNTRHVLIVGSGQRACAVSKALQDQTSWGHEVVGYLDQDNGAENAMTFPCLGRTDDFERMLHEWSVDEVVFALPEGFEIKPMVELCKELGVSVRIVPTLWDPDALKPLRVEHVQDIPTLTLSLDVVNVSGYIYKRLLDYTAGFVGFMAFVLTFPLVALAIRLDSPGPVLFKQPRVGKNRRIFYIYKYRSMYIDAEERKAELMKDNLMQGMMFKMENDPRVTRVGRFLRKTSLDELPQFLNVMKGEMSLVGTRPPTPDEVAGYENWHHRRISVRPGITGLWQISGRNKINDFNEVVRLDLEYIDNWRFLDDLKILWKTVFVVLRRKGAL